ncbi:hypothetical protein CU097_001182, partial [Rhizopus azygosporus]
MSIETPSDGSGDMASRKEKGSTLKSSEFADEQWTNGMIQRSWRIPSGIKNQVPREQSWQSKVNQTLAT